MYSRISPSIDTTRTMLVWAWRARPTGRHAASLQLTPIRCKKCGLCGSLLGLTGR